MPDTQVPIPRGALIIDLQGLDLTPDEVEWITDPRVGGLILFSRNFESTDQVQALVKSVRAVRPDLVLCVDQEGGRVQRFREGLTRFPAMQDLVRLVKSMPQGQRANQMHSVGWLLATELLSLGIDLSFAPVLDIDQGQNEVIGDRAFGVTSAEVIEYAGNFIDGMRAAGMVATGKHFPGHGYVNVDSHLALPTDPRDFDQLEADMQPFVALLSKLDALMIAHVRYPVVDEAPAGFSETWLKQQLRARLGYTGVIVSDDLCMGAACEFGTVCDRAQAALQAGCEVLIVCNQPNEVAQLMAGSALVERDLPAISRLSAKPPAQLPLFSELGQWAEYVEHSDALLPLLKTV